jgi:chemotaxis methyl-accepting protein methylase
VSTPLSDRLLNSAIREMSQSRLLRVYFGRPYLRVNGWIWRHLPASLRSNRSLRSYGSHLHSLIQLRTVRMQSTGTYFFRNRPELEVLSRLLDRLSYGSTVDMAVLGCSKGAEVYSMSYAVRTARQDLKLRLIALDIDKDTLEFAKTGVYSLRTGDETLDSPSSDLGGDIAAKTSRGQPSGSSVFERMSSVEIDALFEREGECVRVRPQFRNAIDWRLGDAGAPSLVASLGPQDIVVANRFLCHMNPQAAEACLHNLSRLVRSGGYLFISGVDLPVRTKVALERGWLPVTDLIEEIHEGDPSLRRDWPLQYWGLEPFDRGRDDWNVRYASVFQLEGHAQSARRTAS